MFQARRAHGARRTDLLGLETVVLLGRVEDVRIGPGAPRGLAPTCFDLSDAVSCHDDPPRFGTPGRPATIFQLQSVSVRIRRDMRRFSPCGAWISGPDTEGVTMGGPVARGAGIGIAIIVPVTLVAAILVDDGGDTEASAWRIPLFFLVLVAFGVAGGAAGRAMPDARFTVGMLAGLGAFALWLPLRALVWWARDDTRGLISGADAVLRPAQLFTAALFACALGFLGGMIGGGRAARRADGSET
jgi:hypothetical protein